MDNAKVHLVICDLTIVIFYIGAVVSRVLSRSIGIDENAKFSTAVHLGEGVVPKQDLTVEPPRSEIEIDVVGDLVEFGKDGARLVDQGYVVGRLGNEVFVVTVNENDIFHGFHGRQSSVGTAAGFDEVMVKVNLDVLWKFDVV